MIHSSILERDPTPTYSQRVTAKTYLKIYIHKDPLKNLMFRGRKRSQHPMTLLLATIKSVLSYYYNQTLTDSIKQVGSQFASSGVDNSGHHCFLARPQEIMN